MHIPPWYWFRHIFEEFRREVLAIDPCVSEEFLKLYVAYKAETNFVDAVPQATRMSLTLNMGFHELQDPKGMGRDVTGIGRWGNGDVEIPLANLEDLPYVIGLVRQAYEKQIGDEKDPKPESTEGRRVGGLLKEQKGAPLNLG